MEKKKKKNKKKPSFLGGRVTKENGMVTGKVSYGLRRTGITKSTRGAGGKKVSSRNFGSWD